MNHRHRRLDPAIGIREQGRFFQGVDLVGTRGVDASMAFAKNASMIVMMPGLDDAIDVRQDHQMTVLSALVGVGVPVATVGIGAAKNAGLLAVQILAAADATLQRKLAGFKARLAEESRAKNRSLQV